MMKILKGFYMVDIFNGRDVKYTEIVKAENVDEIKKVLLQEGYSKAEVDIIRFRPMAYCGMDEEKSNCTCHAELE
jgi:hypothetical protein